MTVTGRGASGTASLTKPLSSTRSLGPAASGEAGAASAGGAEGSLTAPIPVSSSINYGQLITLFTTDYPMDVTERLVAALRKINRVNAEGMVRGARRERPRARRRRRGGGGKNEILGTAVAAKAVSLAAARVDGADHARQGALTSDVLPCSRSATCPALRTS